MYSTNFQGWVANLSDGSTRPEWKVAPGEASPWQQLIEFIYTQNLKITNLRLIVSDKTFTALPHKAVDGYFQAREIFKSVFTGVEEIWRGIGSVVGETVFIIWVSNEGNVRQDIRPLDSVRIHTTLARDKHGNNTTDT